MNRGKRQIKCAAGGKGRKNIVWLRKGKRKDNDMEKKRGKQKDIEKNEERKNGMDGGCYVRGGKFGMLLAGMALAMCTLAGCAVSEESGYFREGSYDPVKLEIYEAERYHIIVYKRPVAKFGDKEPVKIFTVTLYENTDVAKMTVVDESINAFPIPEEFLTFYYEMSKEESDFYASLID